MSPKRYCYVLALLLCAAVPGRAQSAATAAAASQAQTLAAQAKAQAAQTIYSSGTDVNMEKAMALVDQAASKLDRLDYDLGVTLKGMGDQFDYSAATAGLAAAKAYGGLTAMSMDYGKGLYAMGLAQTYASSGKFNSGRAERAYSQAKRALDQSKWEEAISAFRIALNEPAHADASLYWIAYAQGKLGHRDEALSSLAALKKDHPNSHWSNDARALEMELRQASGQSVSPDTGADDDIKLLAINSLMHSDPERALPILQKMLTGSQSPKVKERALFVLSQSDSPKAREIALQIAKGAGNPDVQRMAIRNLAVRGGKENLQALSEIYASSSDVSVRREVLRSYMISGAREQIATAAKSEKEPSLRREAIRQLGALGDQKLLGELYGSESDAVMRGEILSSLMVSGATTKLIELANNEKDASARRKAIQLLGVMDREKTGPALLDLYNKESDPDLKKKIISALFTQGNVKPLIDLARKEKDPQMKREAVRYLSMMKSKEATDFMLEVLQ